MGHFFHVEGIAAALAILGSAWTAILWLLAKRDESRANRRFVRDVGTNHLPHIYKRLGEIGWKLGLEPEQPPPVKFEEPEA